MKPSYQFPELTAYHLLCLAQRRALAADRAEAQAACHREFPQVASIVFEQQWRETAARLRTESVCLEIVALFREDMEVARTIEALC